MQCLLANAFINHHISNIPYFPVHTKHRDFYVGCVCVPHGHMTVTCQLQMYTWFTAHTPSFCISIKLAEEECSEQVPI